MLQSTLYGSLHFIALIAIPAMVVWLCWKFGTKPKDGKSLVKRAVQTAVIGVVSAAVLFGVSCKCGPGNNPDLQRTVPMIVILALASCLPPGLKTYGMAGALMAFGYFLINSFYALVLGTCLYTGDPDFIENSCTNPSIAVRQWHTGITGLYGLELRK